MVGQAGIRASLLELKKSKLNKRKFYQILIREVTSIKKYYFILNTIRRPEQLSGDADKSLAL
jgi:hypothetical protein